MAYNYLCFLLTASMRNSNLIYKNIEQTFLCTALKFGVIIDIRRFKKNLTHYIYLCF